MTPINKVENDMMVETPDGRYAINLNPEFRAFNWVFYKHPDGQWVTLRPALPTEILEAQIILEKRNTEPQRG